MTRIYVGWTLMIIRFFYFWTARLQWFLKRFLMDFCPSGQRIDSFYSSDLCSRTRSVNPLLYNPFHPHNPWSKRNLWSFSCVCNLLCCAFNCAVFVVLVHSVFRLHFFMIFFVCFIIFSYLCPWKQLVHGLGMCFQDILVLMFMRKCLAKATPSWHQKRTFTKRFIFYSWKSGKLIQKW